MTGTERSGCGCCFCLRLGTRLSALPRRTVVQQARPEYHM